MGNLNFGKPEIDPEKIKLFGPIEQHGSKEDEDWESREFITPEGSRRAMKLLKNQVLDRIMVARGMVVPEENK